MHARSPAVTSPPPDRPAPAAGRAGLLRAWAWTIRFAGVTLATALSPATYDAATRRAVAQSVCLVAWQTLPGYALMTTLVCVVLTQLVTVTAQSYGLSQLALEAVVRVFVLELIPLSAAVFVALRAGQRALEQPSDGLVATVVSSGFAVIALAAINGVVALVVTYLVAYGFSPWGLSTYSRLIGQVFDPVVGLGLTLKTLLFSLTVALVPAAVANEPAAAGQRPVAPELRLMSRLLGLLVLIEAASLGIRHV